MSRPDRRKCWLRAAGCMALLVSSMIAHAQVSRDGHAKAALAAVGRTATPEEVKVWDIDVRPDFKGLPKGRGSVAQGELIWEARCAACHGSFGESSEFFTPIVGGVSPDDMKSGRVDGLLPGANQPQRTMLMKLSTLSTLWDYINRAMPWNAPKTLTTDEVYAVTAYVLTLGNIVPADFTLSDGNIRDVQARLPNRNGMTTAHGLWPGGELGGNVKPDVQGSTCMNNCTSEVAIKSFLPDYARNAHGNLAAQSRSVGAARGADTTKPSAAAFFEKNRATATENRALDAPESIATAATVDTAVVMTLMQKNGCTACHGVANKLLGPSFDAIALKYKARANAADYLSGKIRSGGQGTWGSIPMPAQNLSVADADRVAHWLMSKDRSGAVDPSPSDPAARR